MMKVLKTLINVGPVIMFMLMMMLTLFSMGLFGAAHGCHGWIVVQKAAAKICHISYNDEIWYNYTLPKKDPSI